MLCRDMPELNGGMPAARHDRAIQCRWHQDHKQAYRPDADALYCDWPVIFFCIAVIVS